MDSMSAENTDIGVLGVVDKKIEDEPPEKMQIITPEPVNYRKPVWLLKMEGAIYFSISFLTPVAALLESDRDINTRSMAAAVIAGTVAGCIALKAFLSQSFHE